MVFCGLPFKAGNRISVPLLHAEDSTCCLPGEQAASHDGLLNSAVACLCFNAVTGN